MIAYHKHTLDLWNHTSILSTNICDRTNKERSHEKCQIWSFSKKIYIISIFIKLIWITVLLMTFNTVNGIFMHTLILFHYPFKLNFMFKHSISPVLLPWAISCLLLYTYITYLCPKSEIDYSAFSLAF